MFSIRYIVESSVTDRKPVGSDDNFLGRWNFLQMADKGTNYLINVVQ